MVTSLTIVNVVKQWDQLRYPLLHKHGFKCHTIIWLPWLPNLNFDKASQTRGGIASTSEVWTYVLNDEAKDWN
jgi:hypothetical protein